MGGPMRPPITVRKLASRARAGAVASAAGCVLVFAGILAASRGYVEQVIRGPEPMTLTQLESADPDALHDRWLDLTAEQTPRHLLESTHVWGNSTMVTRRVNHFVVFGERAYVVETGRDTLPPRFEAWASTWHDANPYYQRARSQLDVWTAGHGSIPLSPLRLETGQSVETVRLELGVTLMLATAGIVYLLWRAIRLLRDFTAAAPIARLRRSVRAGEGIPALIKAIDTQLAGIDPGSRSTGVFVVPGWLISAGAASFDLMSADDIVWITAYTRTTRLYMIPLWRRHLLKAFDRQRRALTWRLPGHAVADAVSRLHGVAPWAAVGGDPQEVPDVKWAAVVEAMDGRRREY